MLYHRGEKKKNEVKINSKSDLMSVISSALHLNEEERMGKIIKGKIKKKGILRKKKPDKKPNSI